MLLVESSQQNASFCMRLPHPRQIDTGKDMFSATSAEKASIRHDLPVSFAHISDPHLVPPFIPWKRFLNKRLLSRHFWQHKRRYHHLTAIREELLNDIRRQKGLSALLVTGDLTNFGTPEEYAQAAQWLKNAPLPPLVVPGNHDAMVPAPYDTTRKLWEPWSTKDNHYPYVRRFGKIALIGLDSAIPAPPFMAYGEVSKAQLKRLERILKDLGAEKCCRVVMLHHPLQRALLPAHKALRNTEAVAEILRHNGAELVLHGHTHDATLAAVQQTSIPLLGVGATSMKHSHPQRIASWNRLDFSDQQTHWKISVMRRSYKGDVLETMHWRSDDFPGSVRTHKPALNETVGC